MALQILSPFALSATLLEVTTKAVACQTAAVAPHIRQETCSAGPGDEEIKPSALVSGTLLSHYKIVEKIGAGGMGEVYRAQDTRLGRDVAIKVLSPHLAATPEARARFEREARTISQLNHPHICTLYDIGHEDGMDYLVMEMLEGETLAHRLEKGPLPVAEVLSLGSQIANALDVAHRRGIVHRDLKPANVMLTKAGTKLMDFGLARVSAITPAQVLLVWFPQPKGCATLKKQDRWGRAGKASHTTAHWDTCPRPLALLYPARVRTL